MPRGEWGERRDKVRICGRLPLGKVFSGRQKCGLDERNLAWWHQTFVVHFLLPFFFQRNPLTQKICLGESSVIEDMRGEAGAEWAGGGGGGGGATYIFKVMENTLK